MKLINSKYRSIKPTLEYLTDEVVMAQAWKKTHSYIRSFNWYADTLALDVSALTIEENAQKWARDLMGGKQLNEIELVPAAKSEAWTVKNDEGWAFSKERQNTPLRPLAHISIRDQTWATAAMMCLADVVETHQGQCDLPFGEARKQNVFSYGNRLLCDWNDENCAWFRWGNSETYRKFFTDYQNFLNRPLELGRNVVTSAGLSEDVYVVNLDISQFFNSIDISVLIDRLKLILSKRDVAVEEEFWQHFSALTSWQWSAESKKLATISGLRDKSLKLGLPQGLVASGFFANAYLCEFDEAIGDVLGKRLNKNYSVVLHDYCRYVDDLRLVVSAENIDVSDINNLVIDFFNFKLAKFGGEELKINKEKTKVTLLHDLDNEGSMSNRIKAIQSELSGPADRDSLESVAGILENLLVTEEIGFSQLTIETPDFGLINLTNFDHDIRSDTLKRFAANRLESIAKNKRKMSSFDGNSYLREEAENELLAKKLIFAWMKDPSLGLVLRKAMEIFPDADLFEPVISAIYNRSSYVAEDGKDIVTAAMMDYLLADIFRSASDFNGYFQRVSYPDVLKPQQLIELIARFAQKVLSNGHEKVFVIRQALMLLAVVNRPSLCKSNSALLQMQIALHQILANNPPEYQPQISALYEVASQITGNFNTYAALFLENIEVLNEGREEALIVFAKRGGPFWLALWKLLRKRGQKDLLKSFKWAEPVSGSELKAKSQFLSKVISSDVNCFEIEHGLLMLARRLIECVDRNPRVIGASPSAIKVTLATNTTWKDLWSGDLEKCDVLSSKTTDDPRFALPNWIISKADEVTDHQVIYWIGSILRASVLGGSDYTGTRWGKSDTVTYSGLKSSWYKRRMGMLHAPEALIGEYATVSQWTSELLMHSLQWPGFESSFVKNTEIAAVTDTASFKQCINSRLKYLQQLTCKTSNLPTIPSDIYRPDKRSNTFRIVTVQPLQPSSNLFSKADPHLNNRATRAIHREHLAAICKLTLRTLETKVQSEGNQEKPYCDLIVFPEVSVHPDDEDLLMRLADKTNSIIFAGFVFTERNGKTVNFARWLIPSYKDDRRQWIIRDQGKEHMTKHEKGMGIEPHRPCQHILEVHGYGEVPFRMTGAICYDATDIKLAADLRDKTDLFVIAAYNQDVKTFDNMAAALQWHMFQHVVICNIGEFGGSTIQAPYKYEYDKIISHVHGSGQISINTADIDPVAFTRNEKAYKEVKSAPAGFSRSIK